VNRVSSNARRRGARLRAGWNRACAALLLAAIGLVPARALPPRAGEVMLIDIDSQAAYASELLMALDPETREFHDIAYPAAFSDPRAVTWIGGKRLVVGDRQRIHLLDSYQPPTNPPVTLEDARLRLVIDLLHAPDGSVYVLDELADPLGEGHSGALFRLDPDSLTLELLVSDVRFGAPRRLVAAPDGTLLVLDPQGRMRWSSPQNGVVFRFDPQTLELESLLSLEGLQRPAALALAAPDTLWIADANLTAPGFPAAGGGVVRVTLPGGAFTDTLAVADFVEPTDLVVLPEGDLLVLDGWANPAGYSGSRGALLRIDPRSGELRDTMVRSSFYQLVAIEAYTGPDFDDSVFKLIDLNGPPARPGDRLRFEASVVNHGPAAVAGVQLETAFDNLELLFGSARAAQGSLALGANGTSLIWSGSAAVGDSIPISVEARVPQTLDPEVELFVTSRLTGPDVELRRTFLLSVELQFPGGQNAFVDRRAAAFPAPRVFALGEDDFTTETLAYDPTGELPRPTDVTFGPDGTLYVLDAESGDPKVLAIDPESQVTRRVYSGGELTLYVKALELAHDGSLLIVDPKAATVLPGVIYRLDPLTGELSEFYAPNDAALFPNPVDIVRDVGGHYLVCDSESQSNGQPFGAILELDGDGTLVATHRAPGSLIDPYGAAFVDNGDCYVIDRVPVGVSNGPSLFWMRRDQAATQFIRIIGPGDSLLQRPSGIMRYATDRLVICDEESNPFHPGRGGLVRFQLQGIGFGSFSMQSFHADLRQPLRGALFRAPDLRIVDFTVIDASGGRPVPGDLFEVTAEIMNYAPMPGLSVGAQLMLSQALLPRAAEASAGTVQIDAATGRIDWSGDLLFRDPVTLTFACQIDSLAAHAAPLEIALQLVGGEAPGSESFSDNVYGPLEGGEVLLLDAALDVFDTGGQGTVFAVDAGGIVEPFRSHAGLVRPVDLHAKAASRFLILDRDADPLGLDRDTGALFELNTAVNTLRTLAAGVALVDPVRCLPAPDGGFYILDAGVECPGEGVGAVLRVGADGGVPSTVICDEAFRSLADLTVAADGRLWITDREANPAGVESEDTGAIFVVDPNTGAVVDTFASVEFVDPTGIMWQAEHGRLFVTDPGHASGGFTGIRALDPETGALSSVLSSPFFGTPTRLQPGQGDVIWVADSTATPPGSGLLGAVYRIALDSQTFLSHYQYPDARAWVGAAQVPAPSLLIRRFAADRQGAVAPGDSLACELVLANPSLIAQPSVTVEVDAPATLRFDPLGGSAEGGALALSADRLLWNGALEAGDSITIAYRAQARLYPGLAPWSDQIAVLEATYGPGATDTLTHYIANATADGELLIADTWSDPRALGGTTGAVFRAELETRELVPILVGREFVNPIALAMVTGSASDVLVLDASAQPGGGGSGRGALWRGSTQNGEVDLLYFASTWRQPVAVVARDSLTAFVLDRDADPYGLRPGGEGPGAVYRVDLELGSGEVIASDERFWEPRDLLLHPTTGMLYVIDSGDGGDSHPGTVFGVDPTTYEVSVIASGGVFTNPRCGAVSADGRLLVLDGRGELGGSLYAFRPGESPAFHGRCLGLRDPKRIVLDLDERMIIVDAIADALGAGGETGTVFRVAPGALECEIYAGGPPLVRPSGAWARFDGTPIASIGLALDALPGGGVWLRWISPPALGGAIFYIYRRALEAGDEQRYEVLNADLPLSGSGELAWHDATAIGGRAYAYLVVAQLSDGGRAEYGPYVVTARGEPRPFFLECPVARPYVAGRGERFRVRFQIPAPGGPGRLDLIDVAGRRVATLYRGALDPGLHDLAWESPAGNGTRLESGIYFLRLIQGRYRAHERLVIVD